jgi:hypothetical protein
MQAVTDVTKRPVPLFRIVPAFIFFNDSLLSIKRFDEGKIQAVIGEVFCPLRLVPFIHPYLIVPPNKSLVQCGESQGGRFRCGSGRSGGCVVACQSSD